MISAEQAQNDMGEKSGDGVARKVIAVVFATRGGGGDVGKMVAAYKDSLESENSVHFRFLALRQVSKEGADKTLTVDVVYDGKKPKKQIDTTLAGMTDSITFVNLDNKEETAQALGEALSGVEAVVACLGNRQPFMPRWAGSAAKQLVAVMKQKNVNRLVCLSSFGIGTDNYPRTPLRLFLGCMLHTFLRSVLKDLNEMEKVCFTSGLDYLVVRPVVLEPSREPRGSWKLLQAETSEKSSVDNMVAKLDVAKFMVQEAVHPTISKACVTIAHSKVKN